MLCIMSDNIAPDTFHTDEEVSTHALHNLFNEIWKEAKKFYTNGRKESS